MLKRNIYLRKVYVIPITNLPCTLTKILFCVFYYAFLLKISLVTHTYYEETVKLHCCYSLHEKYAASYEIFPVFHIPLIKPQQF